MSSISFASDGIQQPLRCPIGALSNSKEVIENMHNTNKETPRHVKSPI